MFNSNPSLREQTHFRLSLLHKNRMVSQGTAIHTDEVSVILPSSPKGGKGVGGGGGGGVPVTNHECFPLRSRIHKYIREFHESCILIWLSGERQSSLTN